MYTHPQTVLDRATCVCVKLNMGSYDIPALARHRVRCSGCLSLLICSLPPAVRHLALPPATQIRDRSVGAQVHRRVRVADLCLRHLERSASVP